MKRLGQQENYGNLEVAVIVDLDSLVLSPSKTSVSRR